MRIAAFSDIHGNLAALEAVLTDIERHSVDYLACLGDLVALGPHPESVIERIDRLGCPVVQGNTDAWYKEPLPADWQPANDRQAMVHDCYTWLEQQLTPVLHDYLLGLPREQRIGPVMCVHGSPRDFNEPMLPDTPDEEMVAMTADIAAGVEVLLCGHTHYPMRRQIVGEPSQSKGGLTVVNVGSVGMPTDGDPRPCYALLQRSSDGWQVQWPRPTYNLEAAIDGARETGLPHVDAIADAWRSGLGLAAGPRG
jgi:predicted phosphodiesterase